MLIEKRISHKINYDVLRNLNKENELEKPSECEPEPASTVEPVTNLIQAVQPSIPVRYTGRKRYLVIVRKYPKACITLVNLTLLGLLNSMFRKV